MRRSGFMLMLFLPVFVLADQGAAQKGAPETSLLTLEQIFASAEFRAESQDSVHWLPRQGGYATLEPSKQMKGAQDIVRVDPATGNQEVLVSAAHLVPKSETTPL